MVDGLVGAHLVDVSAPDVSAPDVSASDVWLSVSDGGEFDICESRAALKFKRDMCVADECNVLCV